MAEHSISTPAPGVKGLPADTVSRPGMSLADWVLTWRVHNELEVLTSAQIVHASEQAWCDTEAALCERLAETLPSTLRCVIEALKLIADDCAMGIFGKHHIPMLRNCAAFLHARG
jgi:hypothetical protein